MKRNKIILVLIYLMAGIIAYSGLVISMYLGYIHLSDKYGFILMFLFGFATASIKF